MRLTFAIEVEVDTGSPYRGKPADLRRAVADAIQDEAVLLTLKEDGIDLVEVEPVAGR